MELTLTYLNGYSDVYRILNIKNLILYKDMFMLSDGISDDTTPFFKKLSNVISQISVVDINNDIPYVLFEQEKYTDIEIYGNLLMRIENDKGENVKINFSFITIEDKIIFIDFYSEDESLSLAIDLLKSIGVDFEYSDARKRITIKKQDNFKYHIFEL